ncbi:MAG: hypothetical protein AAF628_15980 [Planctomycetota bacterium]
MSPSVPAALVALAISASPFAQQIDEAAWKPHRSLDVLYAGKTDGHREKVFGEFLNIWFDRSATIPLEDLSTETAADYDVVIVDWMSRYGCDGYPERTRLNSAPANLDANFTKPIIAMTYVGTQVRRDYKLDWL